MKKKAFDLSAITQGLPSLPDEGQERADNVRPVSFTVPIAKAMQNQHRNAMAELSALEATIEQRKAQGLQIDEVDPELVDPSPYWDRDLRFLEDKSFEDFLEDLRRNGQQSPALLRPHPTVAGRFEVCFGHRRSFACKHLGIRLRAVVRNLSEAQMAGAAYSENAHREGVSILEQARALARYVERGVFQSKQALADALNVSRSHVSNLTSFSEIPDVVLEALGDWRRCTFRDASSLLKAVKDPARQDEMLMVARRLAGDETQLGYAARLGLLLGRQPVANAAGDNLKDEAGQVIVERKRGKRSAALAFPSSVGDGLAEFVWSRLPDLVADYRKLQGK